ncbi:inner core protein [Chenuda virus]|uniref:Inner core protein n=1 Tax=Chenuda virus TaxID=40065 RepID=A0A0H4M3S0_9REOV|nr:inner core protein [Chenuda virus]AKP24086.1 inner core protein [Chenuda virus]
MANLPNREPTPAEQTRNTPYLQGNELQQEDGPILSLFALQEIVQKVRQAQAALRNEGREVEAITPELEGILRSLIDLRSERGYRVERRVPTYYRFVASQSRERFFRVNAHFEAIAGVSDSSDLQDPVALMSMVLSRVAQIREAGSFILHDAPTHFVDGREVIDQDALGMEIEALLGMCEPRDRHILCQRLDQLVVQNQDFQRTLVDVYPAAVPGAVFQVHQALTAHVLQNQRVEFRRSLEWLQAYGTFKRVDFSPELLTDIFAPDTIYVQSFNIPANPALIWEVPRSGVPNLIINAALGVPRGAYILPNPRISAVTIASRVTTTTPFGQILNTVPTEAQMNDVRKIYLALQFPNQILIDVRPEPGHQIDEIVRAVAGILGKLLFSYGPHLYNITPHAARMLDQACASFLQLATDDRRTIRRGPSGRPLDFTIVQGQRHFDCNVLAAAPARGNGFNSWNADTVGQQETPYPHVGRFVQYLGYRPEEILDERFSGDDYRYPLHDVICEALAISGHVHERNYLEAMRQHHVVRLAYISQIINRDLISAFTLPDDRFAALAAGVPQDARGADGPVILDVSYHAIIHAFRLRFLPVARSDRLVTQPVLESVYASYLSVAKFAASRLQAFVDGNAESFPTARPLDVWRSVYRLIPAPVRSIIELTGQLSFVTGRDVIPWIRSPVMQESIPLLCERVAWGQIEDPSVIGFSRDVFLFRERLPEYPLEDVEEFRREARFYTNHLDHRPDNDRFVLMDRANLHQFAGEGRLRIVLRELLDDDLYVQVGNVLRPLVLRIFHGLPPSDVLLDTPYEYVRASSSGPLARVRLTMVRRTHLYYTLYTADELSFPDELVSLTPNYSLTHVFLPFSPVERVDVNTALNVITRDLISIRARMRIMDLAAALEAGSQYAAPTPAP